MIITYPNSNEVCPLGIYHSGKQVEEKQTGKGRTGVHIHFDDSILDCGLDLFLRGTRTAVENEEPGA